MVLVLKFTTTMGVHCDQNLPKCPRQVEAHSHALNRFRLGMKPRVRHPGLNAKSLTVYASEVMSYCCFEWEAHSLAIRLVLMLGSTKNGLDVGGLPLWNAVFCLDCEVISNSRGDECPVCKGRSLVSLARVLGGSLFAHREQQSQECVHGFDITITVELQQMDAKDVTTTVERLTTVIAPKLARDQATLHVNVKPSAGKLKSQGSFGFTERNAA